MKSNRQMQTKLLLLKLYEKNNIGTIHENKAIDTTSTALFSILGYVLFDCL